MRNESKDKYLTYLDKKGRHSCLSCIINQSEYFLLKDLSNSIFVRTRKMVNYG